MSETLFTRSALLLAAFVVSCLTAAAQGFNAQYLPFSESKLRRFPLTRTELDAREIRSDEGVVVSGIRMREEEKEVKAPDGTTETVSRLVFTGLEKGGQQWRVETEPGGFYDAAYEGDLDRNGIRDIVISIGTGGNGLAPPTRLIFLTFNRRGWVTHLEAVGYFDPQPDRIYDLADLDGDRRAELLYMVYDDGYWITNVYRVRDARWSRVEGRFAGLSLPAYTRFTNRPNHRPVRPAPGRNPVAPDLLKQNRER